MRVWVCKTLKRELGRRVGPSVLFSVVSKRQRNQSRGLLETIRCVLGNVIDFEDELVLKEISSIPIDSKLHSETGVTRNASK
jgi:hypothetical protein